MCIRDRKNGEASEVYYNLGNSYYKIGEIAKAVLNYEREMCIRDRVYIA